MDTPMVLAFLYPDADPASDWDVLPDGTIAYWNETLLGPQPTAAEIEAQRKPYWASRKREEIYLEQELRSKSFYPPGISRFQFLKDDELYTEILPNKNAITQADTPIHWGEKQLYLNGQEALAALRAWVDNPAKTADDIIAFDVEGWNGWDVPRPE